MNPFKSKIRVRVHKAFFVGDNSKEEYFFINITNLHKKRDIVISHVYFQGKKAQLGIINPQRVLPVRLTPAETWETWIRVGDCYSEAYNNFRVRTSSGKIIASKRATNVPTSGQVPGK